MKVECSNNQYTANQVLHTLSTGDEVIYHNRGIHIEFQGKRRVLSTSVLNGGVQEELEGSATVLRLHVAHEDMGKVIGKQGRIAKAIRTVLKAAAIRKNIKVIVDIG